MVSLRCLQYVYKRGINSFDTGAFVLLQNLRSNESYVWVRFESHRYWTVIKKWKWIKAHNTQHSHTFLRRILCRWHEMGRKWAKQAWWIFEMSDRAVRWNDVLELECTMWKGQMNMGRFKFSTFATLSPCNQTISTLSK